MKLGNHYDNRFQGRERGKKVQDRAGAIMAQQVAALVALGVDPGSVPSIHGVAHNHL